MIILIIIGLIFILSGISWLIKKYLSLKICPICAGVFTTWFFMFLGMLTGKLGLENFQIPTALLMGGSVVGLAYKFEAKIKKDKSIVLWKVLFIPVGFALAYSLVLFEWTQALIFFPILGFIVFSFLKFGDTKKQSQLEKKENAEKLKDKLENCC